MLLTWENAWSPREVLELLTVVFSAIATITSYVYTIYTAKNYRRKGNMLKLNKSKDKLRADLNVFFGIYSTIDDTDKWKVLLGNVNIAQANLVQNGKKALKEDDPLLLDIMSFAKMWKQFSEIVMKENVKYSKLGQEGKDFIKDSLTYANLLDVDDYEVAGLLKRVKKDLEEFLKIKKPIVVKPSTKKITTKKSTTKKSK